MLISRLFHLFQNALASKSSIVQIHPFQLQFQFQTIHLIHPGARYLGDLSTVFSPVVSCSLSVFLHHVSCVQSFAFMYLLVLHWLLRPPNLSPCHTCLSPTFLSSSGAIFLPILTVSTRLSVSSMYEQPPPTSHLIPFNLIYRSLTLSLIRSKTQTIPAMF